MLALCGVYDQGTAQAYLHPSLFESTGDFHDWLWYGSEKYVVFAVFVPGFVKAVGLVRVNLNSGAVETKLYVFYPDARLEECVSTQCLWWASILEKVLDRDF
jgi:hypothetical protein